MAYPFFLDNDDTSARRTPRMAADAMERFEESYIPEPNSGCWLWLRALSVFSRAGKGSPGYGLFWFNGKQERAHRVAWKLFRGELSDEITIDHKCRVRCCVNPDHLEPVPIRINVLRGTGPTALNAHKTHCPKGHPLSGENVCPRPRGYRECRTCRNERERRRNRARALVLKRQKTL